MTLAACSDGGESETTVDSDCTTEYEFETVTEGTLTVATYDFLLDAIIQEMHEDGTIAETYEAWNLDPELSKIEEVTTL